MMQSIVTLPVVIYLFRLELQTRHSKKAHYEEQVTREVPENPLPALNQVTFVRPWGCSANDNRPNATKYESN